MDETSSARVLSLSSPSTDNNAVMKDLDAFLVDENYEAMSRTFLAVGKGRRPTLPPLTLTNKLLLQLNDLREKNGRTWKDLQGWFQQTAQAPISTEKIRPLIESVAIKFKKLTDAQEMAAFLEECLDLDFISTSLSELGITRSTVLETPVSPPSPVFIKNSAVIDFFTYCGVQKVSTSVISRWFSALMHCNQKDIEKTIKLTHSTYQKLRKNKSRNPSALNEFLNSEFRCETSGSTIHRPVDDKSVMQDSSKRENRILKDKLEEKSAEMKALQSVLTDVKHNELMSLNDNENLKKEISKLQSKLDVVKKSSNRQIKMLKRKFKGQILLLKNKNKKEIADLCKSYNEQIKTLSNNLLKSKKIVKNLKKTCSELKEERADLLNKSYSQHADVNLKANENNMYSDDVRQTVISLMCDAGVAAANVSKVISIVAENIFHHKFTSIDKLPCTQSALNMCDEGHVLSQIQIAESVLNSKNATLHSDGTSRDHKKIVGHQISLDDGSVLFLGYTPVASEDANTLLDITISVLKKLSVCYDSENVDSVFKSILSKITSTMTDRAACMKSYDKKFEEFLRSELGENVRLHFLHCNAHFLLGLSQACDKAISSVEKDIKVYTGQSLGRDKNAAFSNFNAESETALNRLIRTVCDVLGPRGDQKNGYRIEWMTFCDNSLIPSFKSNRFNCFFEASAALIFHYHAISKFFSSGILPENPNRKMLSVSYDIQDSNLMTLVCAIAIFYLKVTGPYWKLINSSVEYTDFYHYVQKLHGCLERWSFDPSDLLNSEFLTVFGFNMTITSPTSKAVQEFVNECDMTILHKALTCISKEAKDVTERQLSDFLEGGCFCVTDDETKIQLKHCHLTNLVGESAFGDIDYDFSKRRRCSLFNRSSVHIVKRNKTITFLRQKSSVQRARLFLLARKQRKKLKQEDREQEETVKLVTRQKMIENQQKKIDKEIKSISRNSDLTRKVKLHGGPCASSEDVENLMSNLSKKKKSKTYITEVFKNEIRFHKALSKSKILKLGKLDDMISCLKIYFNSQTVI